MTRDGSWKLDIGGPGRTRTGKPTSPVAYRPMREGALPVPVWRRKVERELAAMQDRWAALAKVVWGVEGHLKTEDEVAAARAEMEAVADAMDLEHRRGYWTRQSVIRQAVDLENALWSARATHHGVAKDGRPVTKVRTSATFVFPEHVRVMVREAEARLDKAGLSENARLGAIMFLRSGMTRRPVLAKTKRSKSMTRVTLAKLVRNESGWWLDQIAAADMTVGKAHEQADIYLKRAAFDEMRSAVGREFKLLTK